MNHRLPVSLGAAALLALVFSGCSGSPTTPPPPPPPAPPANAVPSITGITVQTRRAGAPADFANAGDTMDVTATVTDAETAVDQLVYQWSAPVGTFTGSGRTVTWTAPATADAPAAVILTLKVIESYGHPGQAPQYTHEVSGTTTVRLHDSVREVGKMTTDFLEAFSQPQTIKDWQVVMKDFNRARCPDPREYDDERRSVEDHIANYVMNSYSIGSPNVRIGFGGVCEYNLRGDACASARVMWNSTGPNGGTTSGIDYVTAIYSRDDARWWLCSSRYDPDDPFGALFYSGK